MSASYLVDTDWHQLTLLINNRRHFDNIEGLRIESLQ